VPKTLGARERQQIVVARKEGPGFHLAGKVRSAQMRAYGERRVTGLGKDTRQDIESKYWTRWMGPWLGCLPIASKRIFMQIH
jgi:hypothetical protein